LVNHRDHFVEVLFHFGEGVEEAVDVALFEHVGEVGDVLGEVGGGLLCGVFEGLRIHKFLRHLLNLAREACVKFVHLTLEALDILHDFGFEGRVLGLFVALEFLFKFCAKFSDFLSGHLHRVHPLGGDEFFEADEGVFGVLDLLNAMGSEGQ
jgi:hypothetical protein